MLTIDANVWVAAADRSDPFSSMSRQFLRSVMQRRLRIFLPAFVRNEIACALARRRQNAAAGRRLADALLDAPHVVYTPMDDVFLFQALDVGTQSLLRAADALYVANAVESQSQLVSWDAELFQRATAITPRDWLVANP